MIDKEQEPVSILNISGTIKMLNVMRESLDQIDLIEFNEKLIVMANQMKNILSTIVVSEYMASFN